MIRREKFARLRGPVGVLVVIAWMACACLPGNSAPPTNVTAPLANATAIPIGSSSDVPALGTCHLGNNHGQPLPDRNCTPGATNPDVHQDNIHSTVCRTGWTKSVRPPISVTGKLKKQIDQAYGLSINTQGELDHLVSLELGGAPSDPRNLWVEVGSIPNPKDRIENQLNAAVCGGLITLDQGQKAIVTDWTTALDRAGLMETNGKICLQTPPTHCVAGRYGTK